MELIHHYGNKRAPEGAAEMLLSPQMTREIEGYIIQPEDLLNEEEYQRLQ
jgi:hypothetical protein